LAYGRTTAYKKIKQLNKRIRIIQGGASASKTISILILLLEYATANDNKLITVASMNLPHLKRGALRDFKNILTENKLWQYYQIEYNKAGSVFTLFNGSVIEFIALDEQKARGARRDVLFINEANLINYETFEQLEIRTRDFIIIDYNPTYEFWAHKKLVQKRDDVDFIICTYKDNEALEQSIVDTMERRQHETNWWLVYGLGQTGKVEGLVYGNWQQTELPDYAELIGYGLDFGYTNDPTAIVAVYKADNSFILDQVCYQKGMFNKDIAEVIKQNGLENVLGVGDSSEPKSIAEIAKEGVKIIGATKTSQDKTKTYNQWAISKIQEMNVKYTTRSLNLHEEVMSYMWKTDKAGESLNVPNDGNDHCLDAAKYRLVETLAPKMDWSAPIF
jgi:phage terminase large subunit